MAQRQAQINGEEIEARIKGVRQKKDRYKAVAGQCAKEIDQLAVKMQELNSQIISTKTEYEVKLGQKDGEITRLEKMLSETRASLQDKSF